jgi:hypothetical protein
LESGPRGGPAKGYTQSRLDRIDHRRVGIGRDEFKLAGRENSCDFVGTMAEDNEHSIACVGDRIERSTHERLLAIGCLHDMELLVAVHATATAGSEEKTDNL